MCSSSTLLHRLLRYYHLDAKFNQIMEEKYGCKTVLLTNYDCFPQGASARFTQGEALEIPLLNFSVNNFNTPNGFESKNILLLIKVQTLKKAPGLKRAFRKA